MLILSRIALIATFGLTTISYNSDIDSGPNDCNLLSSYEIWLNNLRQFPPVRELKALVDYRQYLGASEAMREMDDIPDGEFAKNYEDFLAEKLLLLSAWVDSRIVTIDLNREVCESKLGKGELIIAATLVSGSVQYKVIPFSYKEGAWKRGFAILTGYSSLLDADARDVLTN